MEPFQHFEPPIAEAEFNIQNALSFALVCELAYRSDDDILLPTLTSWGFTLQGKDNILRLPDIDSQYFVMSNDEHIIVAFRGTDSVVDWVSNVQASYDPGPLPETKVHKGFQDALYPAVIKLIRLIERSGIKHKKLWITGHSLGAALCTLFTAMLAENNYRVFGNYTFASPRVGDPLFAEKFSTCVQGPNFRVVNSGDVVPHIPAEPYFSHVGQRIILRYETAESTADTWLEERLFAFKQLLDRVLESLDLIDNHNLNTDNESYIPKLIRLKNAEAGV